MKCLVLLFFSIVGISIESFAQNLQNQFFLKGELSGQKDGQVYLSYTYNNKQIKDSSYVKENKFFLKGNLSEPVKAFLTLKEEKFNERHSVGFFIEPSLIKIKVPASDFTKAKITGSVSQDETIALDDSKKALIRKYKKLLDSLDVEKDAEKYDKIKERLIPYFFENDQKNFAFYAKHPQSYITPYGLRFYINTLSLDSLHMFYNAMGTNVKGSFYGKLLGREIELLAGGSPGSMAKNFTKTDINGNTLNLVDLKGKYVLLDFWASWCVPCRKGNPHLIQLYKQYKEKGIEFIGVSDDDRNPDTWRKAVDKDSLPWRHILRGLDMQKHRNNERNENDVNENFGIHLLPTMILIDRTGLIVGRFSENAEELDETLKKIFHN